MRFRRAAARLSRLPRTARYGIVCADASQASGKRAAADAKTILPTRPSARKMIGWGKAGKSGRVANCAVRKPDTRAFARIVLIRSSVVRFA